MAPPDVRIADNPFFVLGLAPDASRIEVERASQKLLGMLELGFAEVATYATPIGPRPRTTDAVRAAVAALRDPQQRLLAELWARHVPAAPTTSAGPVAGDAAPAAFPAISRRRLGWP